jgi:hypothetical protein
MKAIARYVVTVLLTVMFFPAVSLAKPGPTPAADVAPSPFGPRPRTDAAPAAPAAPAPGSIADLAAREQRSKELQSFRGGAVYVYLGSGALVVLVVVLLILLI